MPSRVATSAKGIPRLSKLSEAEPESFVLLIMCSVAYNLQYSMSMRTFVHTYGTYVRTYVSGEIWLNMLYRPVPQCCGGSCSWMSVS